MATYYIGPTGSGTEGTRANPCALSRLAASGVVQPGDTWVLLDGTYGTLTLNGSAGINDGTAVLPITVIADNERQARMLGTGGEVLRVANLSYWTFQGLRIQNVNLNDSQYDNVVVAGSDHLVFRRNLFHHSNQGTSGGNYLNVTLVQVEDSSYCLFEENEFWDCGRNMLQIWNSGSYHTIRRNYFNLGNAAFRTGSGITIYPSDGSLTNCLVENNFLDQEHIDVQGHGPGTTGHRFFGNIGMGDYGGLELCREYRPTGSIWRDNVFKPGSTWPGMYIRGSSGALLENNTVIGALGNFIFDANTGTCGGAGSPSLTSSNNLGLSGTNYGFYGDDANATAWTSDHDNEYGAGGSGNFVPGTGDGRYTSPLQIAPGTAQARCPAFILPGSPYWQAGAGGANIGATILYTTEDGTVTTDRLWDEDTSEILAQYIGTVVTGVNDGSQGAGGTLADFGSRLQPDATTADFQAAYGLAGSPAGLAEGVGAAHDVTSVGLVYYISPTGSDGSGDGSSETPWATIQKFIDQNPIAGSTLYCKGGTYSSPGQSVSGWGAVGVLLGTAAAPITIRNAPGEVPVFSGGSNNFLGLGPNDDDSAGSTYVVIDGLRVENRAVNQTGIIYIGAWDSDYSHVHHITIRNCYFSLSTGSTATGHCIYPSKGCEYITVEDCHFVGPGDSTHGGYGYHAYTEDSASPRNLTVQRNIFEGFLQVDGGGLTFWSDSTTGSILHNTFLDNQLDVDLWNHLAVTLRDNAFADTIGNAIRDPNDPGYTTADHNFFSQEFDEDYYLLPGQSGINAASDGTDAGALDSGGDVSPDAGLASGIGTAYNVTTGQLPVNYVQSIGSAYNSTAGQTSTVLSVSKSVATGNAIVVGLSYYTATVGGSEACSDNLGNVYTRVEQTLYSQGHAVLFVAPVTTGGTLTTITATHPASDYNAIAADEFNGVGTLYAVGLGSGSSGTSVTWATNRTIPAYGAAIGAAMTTGSDLIPTAGAASGSPSTTITNGTGIGGGVPVRILYALPAGSNVSSFNGTATITASWVMAGAGGIYNHGAGSVTQAAAGLASATGTGYGPSTSIKCGANLASASGVAYGSSAAIARAANLASGAGSALAATIRLGRYADAGLASGAGSALEAEGRTGEVGNAELASGSGAAIDASFLVGDMADAELASAAGSALGPSVALTATAGLASGTGVSEAPTVTTTSTTQAPAELATGAGAALDVTVSTSAAVDAGLASGAGTAEAGSVLVGEIGNAELASGAGTALEASILLGQDGVPDIASGVGAALPPTFWLLANGGIADASGEALAGSVALETVPALADAAGAAYPVTWTSISTAVAYPAAAAAVGAAYGGRSGRVKSGTAPSTSHGRSGHHPVPIPRSRRE